MFEYVRSLTGSPPASRYRRMVAVFPRMTACESELLVFIDEVYLGIEQ
jgi:hypothetical protein